MVVPFARLFQPIASLRPLLTRGLPQSDLDKLFRLRSKIDYSQGIPVNPANRPIAPPQEFSAQAFSASPFEAQSFRIPGGISPRTRPIPGGSIDDVVITPSIAESYEPRIARSTPFQEPPVRRWGAGAFESREITVGLKGGGRMTYTPLQPDEIIDVEKALKQDPGLAYVNVLLNLDDAKNPQEFARALSQASIVRKNLVLEPNFQDILNSTLARNSRRMGITDTDYEDIISPILYRNSPELPSERAAESFTEFGKRQDWAARMTSSEELAVDTRKIIASTKRIENLDELDIKGNGSIYRMFVAGELTPEDAKKLIDQVNYRRINLLQSDGVISKSVKNRIRDEGGVRGIALLDPSILRGSDGQKAQIYKAAIQTSESSDELAQVYSIIQSDVTSPAYLDVLEEAIAAKTSIIGDIEDVARVRAPQVARSTIDEESIASANRAITQDEARRALDDDTRPAFPGDDVDPEETTNRRLVTNPETGQLEEVVEGGATNKMLNRSLSTPPEPPSVPPGQSGMLPGNERNVGPGAYNSRTVDNAQQADITIAIAANRGTGGEWLTERAALGGAGVRRGINKRGQEAWVSDYGSDGQYGRVTALEKIDHLSADIDSHVDSIVSQLNRVSAQQGRPVIINGAGNGLASLPSQAEADAFARHLIKRIVENPNRSFEIDYLVTGGQNGYDVALAKAAKAYGIRVRINPPYTSRGSIMLQDPNDIENMIFMSPEEYVRKHKLDTGDIGADY
jgi:hypothetical protein